MGRYTNRESRSRASNKWATGYDIDSCKYSGTADNYWVGGVSAGREQDTTFLLRRPPVTLEYLTRQQGLQGRCAKPACIFTPSAPEGFQSYIVAVKLTKTFRRMVYIFSFTLFQNCNLFLSVQIHLRFLAKYALSQVCKTEIYNVLLEFWNTLKKESNCRPGNLMLSSEFKLTQDLFKVT